MSLLYLSVALCTRLSTHVSVESFNGKTERCKMKYEGSYGFSQALLEAELIRQKQ
jgi:hypothetical protein